MVLCKQSNGNTNLYVFGSNHFGQLGNNGNIQNGTSSSQPHPIKSLVPIRVNVSSANIRLIHTKFFCSVSYQEFLFSFSIFSYYYLYIFSLLLMKIMNYMHGVYLHKL